MSSPIQPPHCPDCQLFTSGCQKHRITLQAATQSALFTATTPQLSNPPSTQPPTVLEHYQASFSELLERIKHLLQEHETIRDTNRKLQNQRDEQFQLNEGLRKANLDMDEQLSTLQETNQKLQTDLEYERTVKRQLKEADERSYAEQQRLQALVQEHNDARVKEYSLRTEAEDKLNSANEAYQRLLTRIKAQDEELATLRPIVNKAENTQYPAFQQLQQQNTDLKQAHDQLSQNFASLKRDYENLSDSYTKLDILLPKPNASSESEKAPPLNNAVQQTSSHSVWSAISHSA